MPGFLLHQGATVLCSHGGQAQPTAPNLRVKVSNLMVTAAAAPYSVAGCGFVPPAGNGPCVTGTWVTAATRVRIEGVPVLLQDSQSVCVPTGTPLVIAVTQIRVRGI
jgi:uncharacterized Zn-binding protein involved in type VI secretion